MENNTGGGVTVETGSGVTAGTSGAGSTGESASDVIRALKKRAQEAEAKLVEIAKKEEAARQEQLVAAGQFGEVRKELEAKLTAAEAETARLAGIAAEFEAQQKATREATIATLPEAQREYAASLPADKLPGFVAAIAGAKPAPPRPGEPGVTEATGKATREEVIANIGDKVWYEANKHRL